MFYLRKYEYHGVHKSTAIMKAPVKSGVRKLVKARSAPLLVPVVEAVDEPWALPVGCAPKDFADVPDGELPLELVSGGIETVVIDVH